MARRTRRAATLARLAGPAAAALLMTGTATASPAAAAEDATAGQPANRAAGSGTITYLKGDNVWVADQDGSGARQVTTTGTAADPWRSPTQSDTGQIVAGQGDLIYRMDQWGKVLNTIDPPNLQNTGGQEMSGAPAHLAVSPDGSKIAYTYEKYSCVLGSYCGMRFATGFTKATGLSDWQDWGVTHYDNPSWITNTRVAVDQPLLGEIEIFDLGAGDRTWFSEDDYTTDDKYLSDLEVSRGTPYAAAIRGKAETAEVVFYRLTGSYGTDQLPQVPSGGAEGGPMCSTSEGLGISSPTWSADGALAAWQEQDGVWMAAMGANPCQTQPTLTIAGASAPSFAAAPLQTTRPHYPPESFTATAKPKVSGKAKVGKRLKATSGVLTPKPTSVRFQWLRDKKAIKGATRATYKVTRKDRGHRLSVRLTAARSGFQTKVVVSAPVRVRR